MKPQRIQLSRARGWRMPPNTLKVDRSTPWGNPFIVGQQGSAIACVYNFVLMACGYHNLSTGTACGKRQDALYERLREAKALGWAPLRGKNLACWCRLGEPCHADFLLDIVNRKRRKPIDLHAVLARYGWRVENGKFHRLQLSESDG